MLEVLGISAVLLFIANVSSSFFSAVFGNPRDILAGTLNLILIGLILLFVVYIIRKINGNWTWKELGFKVHRSWGKDMWSGIVVYGVLYIIGLPLQLAILPSGSRMLAAEMGGFLQMSVPLILLSVTLGFPILGFITGGFRHEVEFRGYLQGLFSRDMAPPLGFFFGLITYVLIHHFYHPEWNMLFILNTLPAGICYGLAYYATGSLLVVITAHTLGNWIPFYAIVLHAKGHTHVAYILFFSLGLVFLILIIIGKKEIKEIVLKTKELFRQSGWEMSMLGVLLAIVYLIVRWGWSILKAQTSSPIYLAALGVFSAITLGIEILKRNHLRQLIQE